MLNNFKILKGCQRWHLFFALLISFQVPAASYLVNKEHSKVKFNVKYMGLTDVEGQFNDYNIHFDLKDNIITNLKGEIFVKSIDTFDKKRDQHLKKDDFFDVAKFPIIKFMANSPIDIKSKDAQAQVLLTIRDKSKPVTVKLSYLGKRTDPWTKKEGLYFKGSFKINRFDYGINWSKKFDSGLVVGEDVEINFTIEAYQSNNRPAFSRFYLPTKSVKREIDLNKQAVSSYPMPVKKKSENTRASVASNDEYAGFSNIGLTLLSTAIVFAITIICGILGIIKLVKLFEEMGISENMTLTLATTIVTAAISLIFYLASKYTGIGVHPFLNQ